MTALSDTFLALADELTTLFGTNGVWTLRQFRNIVDPNDPTDPGHVDHTDTSIKVAITAWEETKYDNINIFYGDQMAIIPALPDYPIPKIGDVLVRKDRYGVVQETLKLVQPIQKHSVNGIVAAYQINLRG